MAVSNPVRDAQRDALPSTATPETLAAAMAALDLANVPAEERAHRVLEQLGRVMVSTLHDRYQAQQITAARLAALAQMPKTPT